MINCVDSSSFSQQSTANNITGIKDKAEELSSTKFPKRRQYFSHISTQPSIVSSNRNSENLEVSNFENTGSFLDGESYVKQLVAYISTEPDYALNVRFICEDNKEVSISAILLCLAWSQFNRILGCLCYSCSNICITVPFESKIVYQFREVLRSGYSTSLSSSDYLKLTSFIKVMKLGWSYENEYDFEESYTGESFSDDERDLQNNIICQFSSRAPERIESNNFCSKTCKNNCEASVDLLPSEKVEMMKKMFKGNSIIETKSKLLTHLSVQSHVGNLTNGYTIFGHEFCLEFLNHFLGISQFLLKSVMKDYWRGVTFYEHGNKGIMKNPSLATVNFISWFKCFTSLYGQNAPDEQVVVLSYWLKGKALYNIYKEEATAPHVALVTFYQHLKTYFGPRRIDPTLQCVRICKCSSHSVCDICVMINMNQKLCHSEAELNMIKSLKNQHKVDFSLARTTIESYRQKAIDFPTDVLFCQVDGMDNSKSYLPRYLEKPKKLVGTERLPTKITGCIIWNGLYKEKRKDLFFLNHDQFGRLLH